MFTLLSPLHPLSLVEEVRGEEKWGDVSFCKTLIISKIKQGRGLQPPVSSWLLFKNSSAKSRRLFAPASDHSS